MSFLPQPSGCCDQNCSTGNSTTTTTIESTVQLYIGSFDDPNGNLIPGQPTLAAEYYKDENLPTIWRWSVNDQMWFATITP